MSLVSCAQLGNQMLVAINAMTLAERAALCSALNCSSTVSNAQLAAALLTLPGAGNPGYVLTMLGSTPTWVAPAASAGLATTSTPGTVQLATAAQALAGTSGTAVLTPSSLAARSANSEMAFAAKFTGPFLLTMGAVRTWTTVQNSDNVQNSSFGTWDGTGSTFTFNQAGSFQFDVNGLLLISATNGSGVVQTVNAGMYLDFGTFQSWAGQLNTLLNLGGGQTAAGAISSTMRQNVTAGSTFKIVGYTDPNASLTSHIVGWGVAGGVNGGGSAVSSVQITRY